MSWLAAKSYNSFCKKFSYTVLNYEVGLKVDPRKRNFKAHTSITLIPTKSSSQFCFLLSNQYTLEAVNYLGLAVSHTVKPAHPGLNLITALLPRKAGAGEKLVIVLMYTGHISGQGDESMELHPGLSWYPHSPCPQKYTCTLRMITDDSVRVISAGNLAAEQPADTKVMTQWSAETPFRGIHVLAGDFIKTSRETQPVLTVYYPRKFMNQGKTLADHCEKLMDFLAEKLGPAPLPSSTVIISEDSRPAANSSFYLTSISTGILDELKDCKSSKDRTIQIFQIAAREMAHRWLKHSLGVNHPQHLWYLDGLAEYLSWLALEAEYGKEVREDYMEEARAQILDGPKISIESESCGVSRVFPRWLVCKASWLLRIVHCLTEDKFLPALRDFYANCRDIAPSPQEFFLTMGKLTGTDLSQVYSEWVQSDRQLVAEIIDNRCFQAEDGQWQLVFSLVNGGKLRWPYPLEIKADLADGSTELHRLGIQAEPHLITTPAKINTLTVDFDMKLLNWAGKKTYTV